MKAHYPYCIITPAFNESHFIVNTIESIINQTAPPLKWIIVDDGSTDTTPEIINQYKEKYNFIKYLYRKKEQGVDYYASNVFAIMQGWESLQLESFDFVAILDADITLPDNYYESIFQFFASDERLGVASGIYENLINGKLYKVLNDRRSTPKAIQIFRREVFESIGGFLPLKYGGEDTIACVMARMLGWRTWSFPEIKVVHHRPTGTGKNSSMLRVRFNQGICEYSLATHPVFFIIKAIRRAFLEKPFILGGILRICGYIWAFLKQEQTLLPDEVIKHIRKEQLYRIIKLNRITQS